MNGCALVLTTRTPTCVPTVGRGGSMGTALSAALHEVPHKGERITLSLQGAEDQVTVGASHFPGAGIASGGKATQD